MPDRAIDHVKPFAFDPDDLPESEDQIDFSDIEARYSLDHPSSSDQSSLLGHVVVVDNLPVVDASKEEKLIKAIKKIFKPAGTVTEVFMPMTKDGGAKPKSKGYAFLEFQNAQQAAMAVKKMNNYALDKSHVLAVQPFMDMEKYANTPDEYKDPPIEEFKEKDHLKSWLADEKGRDQWVLHRGDEVTVAWNEQKDPPQVIDTRTKWTDLYVEWSPLGSYLATVHHQGVALWGGARFTKVARLVHPSVQRIHFSPSERYLVTWSREPISLRTALAIAGPAQPFGQDDEGNQLAVWDVLTCSLLRTFPHLAPGEQPAEGAVVASWPMLKWSASEKYFARLSSGSGIMVYETSTMRLLDKKSIKIDNVRDFAWATCPGDELLCYWTPEVDNQPARVTLMSLPGREIVRTKNLFNVRNILFHWHPEGDFLCVQVDLLTKSKKVTYTNLELFRVHEKDIPVEVVEFKDNKAFVTLFAWEPTGRKRFAVLTSTDPTPIVTNQSGMAAGTKRVDLHFFAEERPVAKKPKKMAGTAAVASLVPHFRLVKTVEKKTSNSIIWSPRGRHLVLATRSTQSVFDIEFWDMDYGKDAGDVVYTKKDSNAASDPAASIQMLEAREHYGITDVEWDPSGRFVLTGANAWRHTMENGYYLWDFKGQLLSKALLDRFYQIQWRPRPKSLLSIDQQKKIRRNLAQYSRLFDEQDLTAEESLAREQAQQRRRLLEEWNSWRARVEKQLAQERQRTKAKGAAVTVQKSTSGSGQAETIEEWIEEVIEEYEEILE